MFFTLCLQDSLRQISQQQREMISGVKIEMDGLEQDRLRSIEEFKQVYPTHPVCCRGGNSDKPGYCIIRENKSKIT